jgi:chromosome partitioning protein
MRRIAIINQKGGVGKTTTSVNLGVALARAGHRVLLMDLDPQAHLSLHVGIDPAERRTGLYEMLTGTATISKARIRVASNLWVVGSSIDLAGAEVELVSVVGREVLLRDLLDQHTSAGAARYDYVLMDCPPSLGVLTLNGLCAAREVFIPLQPHYLALQGLGKLLETVSLVSRRINPGLEVAGVVVCMHDAGTRLAAEVIDDVRTFFENDRDKGLPWSSARVFHTVIRRNIKLAEAPSYGQSIFDYAPGSNGAHDYEQLAREVHDGLAAIITSAAEPAAADVPPVSAEESPTAPDTPPIPADETPVAPDAPPLPADAGIATAMVSMTTPAGVPAAGEQPAGPAIPEEAVHPGPPDDRAEDIAGEILDAQEPVERFVSHAT